MKRLLSLLAIALALAVACRALMPAAGTLEKTVMAPMIAPAYLLQQDFETTTGATPPAGWTNVGGVWNFGSTTVVLQGTQSAQSQAFGASTASATFTGQTELWGFFLWETTPIDTGGSSTIMSITDGGSNKVNIGISTSGVLSMSNTNFDGALAQPSGSIAGNAKTWIWYHYKAGASAGIMELAWSATSTKPISGTTNYAISNVSTMNVTMTTVIPTGNADNVATYHDHVLINNSNIGDNP